MNAESARDIVDVVFGVSSKRRGRLLPLAMMGSLVAHAAAAVYWIGAARTPEPQKTVDDMVVDLPPPEPPKPAPPPPSPPHSDPPPAPSPPHSQAMPAAPPPPAAAAQVIAQEPRAPVDLTSDVAFTGSAKVFAGGVTSSTGTSSKAVAPPVPILPPLVIAPPRPDHSSPARPSEQDWHCAWPTEAENADLDQQAVLVQVTVTVDGTPHSAHAVTDPGLGFARAAVKCALSSRFEAARNREGIPVAAISPPIRVNFYR